MKTGIRTPSPGRSIRARTSGKLKRAAKRSINPIYGKGGIGYVNNPSKAIYNKVYNKTTLSALSSSSLSKVSLRTDAIEKEITYNDIWLDDSSVASIVENMQEAIEILSGTTNPNIFFSLYDFLFECCRRLYSFESAGLTHGVTVEAQALSFYNQIPSMVDSFIQRTFDEAELRSSQTNNAEYTQFFINFFNSMVVKLEKYGKKYLTLQNSQKLKDLARSVGVEKFSETRINIWPQNLSPSIIPTKDECLDHTRQLTVTENNKGDADRASGILSVFFVYLYLAPFVIIDIFFYILNFYKLFAVSTIILLVIGIVTYYATSK